MKIITCAAIVIAAATLSGCIVAPVQPGYYDGPYGAPAGVVYVAPTYVSPGPGYAWGHNARFGWGWRHPYRGWHRGWR